MAKVKDKLGREINVGDICIVARSEEPIVFGKITHIDNWSGSVYYRTFKGRHNPTMSMLLTGELNINNTSTCRRPDLRTFILKRNKK